MRYMSILPGILPGGWRVSWAGRAAPYPEGGAGGRGGSSSWDAGPPSTEKTSSSVPGSLF